SSQNCPKGAQGTRLDELAGLPVTYGRGEPLRF
ncbi:unnamed protein product, partial [marine sediment metagenome]